MHDNKLLFKKPLPPLCVLPLTVIATQDCSRSLVYVVIIYTAFLALVIGVFAHRICKLRRKSKPFELPKDYIDFVYNESIDGLLPEKGEENCDLTGCSAMQISTFVRHFQALADKGMASLWKECSLVREFFTVLSDVDSTRVNFNRDVDPGVNLLATKVPVFLLQAFVAHAARMAKSADSFFVDIKIKKVEGGVSVVLRHSYFGSDNINITCLTVSSTLEAINKLNRQPILFTYGKEKDYSYKVTLIVPDGYHH